MKRILTFLNLFVIFFCVNASNDTVRVSCYKNIADAVEACRRLNARVLFFDSEAYDFHKEQSFEREWFISNTSSETECPSKIKRIGILLENLNDLTVDGNGSSLIYHDPMITIAVVNCRNITVKNFSVDYARPTMSEMLVEHCDSVSTTVRFHDDSRYEIDGMGHLTLRGNDWVSRRFECIGFDPANEHLTFFNNAWRTLDKSEAVDLGNRRVKFKTPPGFNAPDGYILTVRDVTRDQVGIFINESDNVELRDMNMRFMHAMGIFSQRSRDITMCNIECAPDGKSGRIMASSADFMHFSGCTGKIRVFDCQFSGAHDDCINIHGTNLRIIERIKPNRLKLRFMHAQSYGYKMFEAGDTVTVVNSVSMNRGHRAVVTECLRLSDREIVITTDRDLPDDIEVDADCIENLTWTPEVEIHDNFFTHTHTRGVLVTTPRKVEICNNVFLRTGMSAILIEGDTRSWYESGPVCDVTIRGNRFIDCGYLRGPANAVIALNPSNPVVDEDLPVHDNVKIVGNVFQTFGNPAIYAKSTSSLVVEDNRIEALFPDLSKCEYIGQPFVLTGCKSPVLKGNVVSGYALRASVDPNMELWDDKPASIWEECYPQGNGRLGAMADGGIRREKIVLNDITLWSGSEFDYSNPEAAEYLPVIRRLLMEGKNVEAQNVMYEHFVPKKSETGGTYGCYQVLADMNIDYSYPSDSIEISEYKRRLDLSSGLSTVEFSLCDSTVFTRLYAVPRGDDGVIVKVSSSKPGALNFAFSLSRLDETGVVLSGHLDSGQEGVAGMAYAVMADVVTNGENARVSRTDSLISVSDADAAYIVVSGATSFVYGDDYLQAAQQMLQTIMADPERSIINGVVMHRDLMGRAKLEIPPGERSGEPTRMRIDKFADDDSDSSLAALYYNLGRYLSIASTRPDLLPPNLQGLWANQISTPWNGDYHTNINVQMNHWPVEQGNLSELHLPVIELTKRAVESGERTAKAFYGPDARGWVMHMMTNIWNYTEPGEKPSWGATNTGGAWLCRHLWEHYLFSGDVDYLRSVYPTMKGAADFFLSTMIEEPNHGWLVTAPSSSPENEFYVDSISSVPVSVCMAPTMDSQLVGELWNNVIEASSLLNIDESYADSLKVAVAKLPPMRIDSRGRLMEWLEEYREADPRHRHVSHLYGLYPGESISFYKTPRLAEAAAASLDSRGDEGTGWSRAWKMNFHARLHNGDRAWKVFKGLLQPAIVPGQNRRRAGTFPNLFCSHPPFQIDGNFGGAAAIGEMLIQSHEGFVELLPALPSAMPHGTITGFKTRGGHEICMEWADGLTRKIRFRPGFQKVAQIKIPKGVTHIRSGDSEAWISVPSSRVITVDTSSEIEFR